MNAHKVFNSGFAFIFLLTLLRMPVPALAQEPVPNPIIWGVTASNDWINGHEWPSNASVEISVDNPLMPGNPDFVTARNTDANGNFSFQVQFDITVGSVVSVRDGSTTKQVTVSNFEVTSIDWIADTISGIGTPNASGAVWGPGWWEPFVVDASGHWQINLAGRSDIRPEDQGFAIEQDGEGDGTQFNWRLPTFMVQLVENQVRSYGWRLGASVILSIDDPNDPGSPDYTGTKLVTPASWDSNQTDVIFELGEAFTLEPGMAVTLTDGYMTKSHTITGIAITNINLEADTVSGTAQPGANIKVGYICEGMGPCAIRRVHADGNGNWSADFSVVGQEGDEQTLFDIAPGTGSWASQQDEDGDETSIYWNSPSIQTSISRPGHGVEGYSWPLGSSVTLTVDNPGNGIDYTDMQVSELNEWGGTAVRFELDDFRLETGAIVTLTDGMTTRTHTVTYLDVTYIEAETDRVSGKAEPGSTVEVNFRTGDLSALRNVIADQAGNWIADFSTPGPGSDEQALFDIQPGIWASISQYGYGRNVTRLHWQIPDYRVVAYPDEDVIAATDFWPGSSITITVDDPDNGVGVDLTRSGIVDTETGGWNCQTWWGYCFVLDLWEEFDVKPGQLITITDGAHTVSHIVTTLSITNVDFAASTVAGVAEPLGDINLQLWPSCGDRHLFADGEGNWLEDFSVPGDEDFEQETCNFSTDELRDITAYQGSGGGETWVGWYVPYPFIIVQPEEDIVSAFDWPLGTLLQVAIDDPETPLAPDYNDSLLVIGTGDWENGLNLSGIFDIQPDQIVTVSGGYVTRQHVVTHIAVTNIDIEADTVSGTGTPGAEIHVGTVCDNTGCASRNINVDDNGNWIADFSVPVTGHGDNGMVFDLQPGSGSGAYEFDEDEDATSVGWEVPYPEPDQCQPGDTVTGTVFENDGVTPIPFADIQFNDYDTGEIRFTTTADSNGTYACSLPDGDYLILAWMENYSHTQEYYNEASDVNATPIHITAGAQFADINFTITPAPAIEHFTFNLDNPLLQDLVVRQAIALGTDRQRILTEAFLPNGIYGMVSNSIVVPEHWASAPASELTLYPFNPAQARTILEAAGWVDRDSDGFRENAEGMELAFTFKTRDSAFRMASGEIFRQNMEAIGIQIITEYTPDLSFTNTGDFDIAEFAWVGCTDDEPCLGEYVSNSAYNYGHYNSPAYDTAIAKARGATGEAAKLPYLIEAQSILTHDLPILPLFTRYDVSTVTTRSGSDVSVSPANYLTVRFAEVTQEGATTVLPTNIAPVALPPNFQLLGQVYDIGTSAQFTTAQVCFNYDDSSLTPAQEATIRLFHLEDNAWVDVTDVGYADTANNIVCGTVSSFSPFAILYSLNQSPQADLGTDLVTDEGSPLLLDASNSSDPEAGPLTYQWDLDNDGEYDDALGVTTFITFPDNGESIVSVQVTDDGGLSDTDSVHITINNVAPTITYLSAPLTPLRLGTSVSTSAMFEDPGSADTFTATWTWEDSSTSAGDLSYHFVSGSHTYAATGVYTVHITVTDDDGGSSSAVYQYIVVYDPTGGFVTGGGWFIDPATGAKAHYGFNPKYQRDSTAPKGETEFRIGDLRFKSTSHEWLVITGTKAQFYGTGTVNGVAGYEFLVTAIDGSPDRVRIKIWDSSTGEVLYDNQPGAPDTADPTTPTGGGSIVIHQ